jgi:hypothetical protein
MQVSLAVTLVRPEERMAVSFRIEVDLKGCDVISETGHFKDFSNVTGGSSWRWGNRKVNAMLNSDNGEW